jgi:hypothetical protein
MECGTLTLTTDQADYAPGSTATFTATNVAVGDTVEFVVTDTDTSDGTASGTSQPWTDGDARDLDGTANGTIVTSWVVGQDALNQFIRYRGQKNYGPARHHYADLPLICQ